MGVKMSGGIRNCCGKCFSYDYDVKLQRCKKCGWMANKEQNTLFQNKENEHYNIGLRSSKSKKEN